MLMWIKEKGKEMLRKIKSYFSRSRAIDNKIVEPPRVIKEGKKEYIKFKHERLKDEISRLQPACLILLSGASAYCASYDLPFIITSILEEKDVKRVSTTHEDGRAFDISVQGWSADNIVNFVKFMNHNFKSIAAISSQTGNRVAVLYHDSGYGVHVHCQTKLGLSNLEALKIYEIS